MANENKTIIIIIMITTIIIITIIIIIIIIIVVDFEKHFIKKINDKKVTFTIDLTYPFL